MSLLYHYTAFPPRPYAAFFKRTGTFSRVIQGSSSPYPSLWSNYIEVELGLGEFYSHFPYAGTGDMTQKLTADLPPGSREARQTLKDYEKYDLFKSNLISLFNGKWDFSNETLGSHPGENPVYHRNIAGEVEDDFSHSIRNDAEFDHNTAYTSFTVNSLGSVKVPPELTLNATAVNYCDTFGDDAYLASLNSRIENGDYDYWAFGSKQNYVYPVWRHTAPGTHKLYHYWVVGRATVFTSYWWDLILVEITLDADVTDPPTFLEGVTYPIQDFITPVVTVKYSVLSHEDHYLGYSSSPNRDLLADFYVDQMLPHEYLPEGVEGHIDVSSNFSLVDVSFPRQPYEYGTFREFVGTRAEGGYYYSQPSCYANFHDRYGRRLPTYVGGCAASSKDALAQYTGGLENNYIETLSEIRQILGPLDTLKAAKVFLTSNYRGGFLPFLKWLANARLAYAFGLIPTITAAQDLYENLGPFIDKFESGYYTRSQTVHGKWSQLLEDQQPFDNVVVTCRSKVRIRPNLDSFMPFIIAAEGVGLLPSLSRVWDLVPYSWLLDTFVDVGSVLDYADYSYFRMLFDIEYSVHSITVRNYYTSADASRFNFRNVDEANPAHAKLYLRYIINGGLQDVVPTSLPLTSPSLAGWDIYGSVLVQKVL